MNGNYSIQVLERTAELINLISMYSDGISLANLSSETNINKTTVFRILENLINFGYVDQDISNGKYKLGYKFVEISTIILSNIDIKKIAHPYLENLSNITSEVVHLVILDGYEGVYIDKVDNSSGTIRMYSQVGKHLLLHSTSVGKVLMSQMNEDEIDNIIKVKGLVKRTENTITNRDMLIKEIAKVKKQGYAVDDVENEDGIRCLAAPVFDYKGRIAAAVSIAGTTLSVTRGRVPELAFILKDTTSQISKAFGGKTIY